jgi:hypothetical protein
MRYTEDFAGSAFGAHSPERERYQSRQFFANPGSIRLISRHLACTRGYFPEHNFVRERVFQSEALFYTAVDATGPPDGGMEDLFAQIRGTRIWHKGLCFHLL